MAGSSRKGAGGAPAPERRREEALEDISRKAARAVVRDEATERESEALAEELEELGPPPGATPERADADAGVHRRDAPRE